MKTKLINYVNIFCVSLVCYSCTSSSIEISNVVRVKIKSAQLISSPIYKMYNPLSGVRYVSITEKSKIDSLISLISRLEKSDTTFLDTPIYCRIILYDKKGGKIKLEYNQYQIKVGNKIYDSATEFYPLSRSLYSLN